MERLEGLDEEFQKEETEKVTSIEEAKKKRPPFHYWEVAGVQHKMKLNTGMITKLENKYRTNIMTLVTANDIPPLGVMLTIARAMGTRYNVRQSNKAVRQVAGRRRQSV